MTDEEVRTILVVDHDRDGRDMVSSALRDRGYRTVVAGSADEAFQQLRQVDAGISAVVTAATVPDMSGTELLEAIHSLAPDLPVIPMIPHGEVITMLPAIRKRAFDFCTIPIDVPQLIQSVERAMRQIGLLELEKNYLDTLEQTVLARTRDLRARMDELQKSRDMESRNYAELASVFRLVELIKKEWENTMDCIGDMVILTDPDGRIRRCNRALKEFAGKSYQELLDRDWRELFSENALHLQSPAYVSGAQLYHEPTRRYFVFNSYPFPAPDEERDRWNVITVHDTSELKRTVEALDQAYKELKETQEQMLQKEKMASIGQLAAGVAHEINNPIGFISSNLTTLHKYVERMNEFISAQDKALALPDAPHRRNELLDMRQRLKIDYILEDIVPLVSESLDGAGRVRKIVQDLKSFSRMDESEFKKADINDCLESTLNIVWNELKYKTTLNKDYGELPPTMCFPQQLEQVFMNLLMNAADAIENHGEVSITTRCRDGSIFVTIADTGSGIPADKLGRIFDPFFTTKGVGKGTGLGLSISADIIKRHNSEISVESEVGKGTAFTVKIPVVEDGDYGRADQNPLCR